MKRSILTALAVIALAVPALPAQAATVWLVHRGHIALPNAHVCGSRTCLIGHHFINGGEDEIGWHRVARPLARHIAVTYHRDPARVAFNCFVNDTGHETFVVCKSGWVARWAS